MRALSTVIFMGSLTAALRNDGLYQESLTTLMQDTFAKTPGDNPQPQEEAQKDAPKKEDDSLEEMSLTEHLEFMKK